MKNVLVLKAKNEDTMLPKVLRVLAQQGLLIKDLHMSTVSSDEVELKIEFKNSTSDFVVKMLSKQTDVLSVSY
jgi:acetolactate synthase regulatory subunit